jgi:hypothetical protein
LDEFFLADGRSHHTSPAVVDESGSAAMGVWGKGGMKPEWLVKIPPLALRASFT